MDHLSRMAILIVCFALLGGVAMQAHAEKDITLMVYMIGSDLESLHGNASADLSTLQFTDYDDRKIDVLVMTGGAKTWHNRLIAGTTEIQFLRHFHQVKLHGVTIRQMEESNRIPLIETEWFDSAQDMGEPDTLTAFLRYCVEEHPAKEYGLVFWGKGSPYLGIGDDELFDNDLLTLEELETAMRTGPFSEDNRLTWVGLDASLMGNVEIAGLFAPYARYMIADEGLMPFYRMSIGLLEALGEGLRGGEAAVQAVSTYIELAAGQGIPVAASCVDLSAVGAVSRAKDELFSALTAQNPAWEGKIMTQILLKTEIDSPLRIWQYYNVYDLRLLSQQCAAQAPGEAKALEDALDRAVLYSGGDVDGAAGLSACS